MKRTKIKTVTYKIGDDWLVDVMETRDEYIAYLYNKYMMTKELLFSSNREQQSFITFINTVESNIEIDIERYKQTYMADKGDK